MTPLFWLTKTYSWSLFKMTWIDFRLCGSRRTHTHTPRIKAVFIVYLWHICDNALLMLLKVLVLKIFFYLSVLIKMFNLFMFLFSFSFHWLCWQSVIFQPLTFLLISFSLPFQNIRFPVIFFNQLTKENNVIEIHITAFRNFSFFSARSDWLNESSTCLRQST